MHGQKKKKKKKTTAQYFVQNLHIASTASCGVSVTMSYITT
jgi:hypothetical protein